jgi:poly-beta-hydroxyalkanoate depolymerase
MSLEPAIDPTAAVPFPGFNPFAAMLEFHKAGQALVRAAHDTTSLWHLPPPVRLAIEAAKAEERCLTRTTPGNTADDFNIASVNIDGKAWPVKTVFTRVSDTCVTWDFWCEANKDKRPMAEIAACSGGHASNMTHYVQANLPFRNMRLLGWADPRDMHKNTVFTTARQGKDVAEFLVQMGRDFPWGYDASGTSQAANALLQGIAEIEREGKHLHCLPANLILAGGPHDVSVGRTAAEIFLHNLPFQEKLLIETADGRKILSTKILEVASNQACGELALTPQDLDGEFWLDLMRRFYRLNEHTKLEFQFNGGVMIITAENDEIVRPIQSTRVRKQLKRVPNDRLEHFTIKQAGHFDHILPGKPMKDRIDATNAFLGNSPAPR